MHKKRLHLKKVLAGLPLHICIEMFEVYQQAKIAQIMIHYISWRFLLCPIQLFSMVLSCVCTTTNPLDYLLTNSYQLWAWHSILLSYSLFSWYPAHCLTNGWMNQSVFSYDVCCWQLMQILWYFYKPLAADDH